jgi:hypothetical protein
VRAVQVPSGNLNLDIFAGGNGKINFFKDSKGTQTKNYILIDNTSANANMTSTLTFANTSDATIGAIKVSSTGTGANLLSTMQITNTNALNISGLGTLSALQLGIPLVLDPNNNIVKGTAVPKAYSLYLAGTAAPPTTNNSANIMTIYGQVDNGFFQNMMNGTVNLAQSPSLGTNYLIMFNPNPTNGGNTGHYSTNNYVNWLNTTFKWNFGNATNLINHSLLVNNGYPLAKVIEGLITFPTTGLYKVTLNIWMNSSLTTGLYTSISAIELQLALNYGYSASVNNFFPTNRVSTSFISQTQVQLSRTISPNITASSSVGILSPNPTNITITRMFIISNDYLSANPDRLWAFIAGSTDTNPVSGLAISAYELSIIKVYDINTMFVN